MKSKKYIFFIIPILMLLLPFGKPVHAASIYDQSTSERYVNQMKTLGSSQQLVLVTATGYHTSAAMVQLFAKNSAGKWKRQAIYNAIIGRYGFAVPYQMSEGGWKSPQGEFHITKAFGRFTNPGTRLAYHQITADDVWVDNVHSPYYNTLQSIRKTHEQSEKMDIPQYNYGFVINYNTVRRVPGKGSAIFFHVNDHRYSYTAGCTAISQTYVIRTLRWLNPSKNPVIIQCVSQRLGKY
ncbi:MAG: L,D-transpeptidase family protein [Sporolactobacillus sp.]